MGQDVAAERDELVKERLKKGMTLQEATSSVWEDWCGKGFHTDFRGADPIPLEEEDVLGEGANGLVFKTICKGVALAWKTTRCKNARTEIDNLKRLNNIHVVTLAGSMTHCGITRILIWPVAECDLKQFLDDLDVFKSNTRLLEVKKSNPEAYHRFRALDINVDSCSSALLSARRLLCERIGCLLSAVAYIHTMDIRHKDIKPSNILLSSFGIWLTDFDCSTDFSQLPHSETNNGNRGTAKYFAPEMARYEDSSRPVDIFSLGCVFLEVIWSVCMADKTMADLRTYCREADRSYHANLSSIQDLCLECIKASKMDKRTANLKYVLLLIGDMLNEDATNRPKVQKLQSRLRSFNRDREHDEWSLYGPCCQPRPKITSHKPSLTNLSRQPNERSIPTFSRPRMSGLNEKMSNKPGSNGKELTESSLPLLTSESQADVEDSDMNSTASSWNSEFGSIPPPNNVLDNHELKREDSSVTMTDSLRTLPPLQQQGEKQDQFFSVNTSWQFTGGPVTNASFRPISGSFFLANQPHGLGTTPAQEPAQQEYPADLSARKPLREIENMQATQTIKPIPSSSRALTSSLDEAEHLSHSVTQKFSNATSERNMTLPRPGEPMPTNSFNGHMNSPRRTESMSNNPFQAPIPRR
ncbi:kinase-like protein [Patellaria atrata CBS 101060]|uniref:Kinase-like protein n=1 Tax=Patellaria atrata CBS 101060 TaxID=1346257 RepID=A0A9P4SGF9_9PEZI|nr:kinase-like protein [Patellaria atrata CBS 101060]